MGKGKGKIFDVLAAVNKEYGSGTILPASQATGLVLDRLPCGIFELDLKIGGGFPRGRITMLKGEYSTGKSAVCMKLAEMAQRTCRFCGEQFLKVHLMGEVEDVGCSCGKREPMVVVWLDAEHSFDPGWLEKWGIDLSKLFVIETEYAEQAIDVADKCIRSKECDLLIVDSIAALTPGIEVEETAENWQIGVAARLINKALRKWTSGLNSYGLIANTKCTIVLVNQMRLNLGGYHPTPTSPGGKGLDFFESIEVRFKKKGFIEDKATKRNLGVDLEFSVKKNKTAPLSGGGAFSLYFVASPGVHEVGDTDTEKQVLAEASFWNLITKSGSWYSRDGVRLGQGVDNAAAFLRNTPEVVESLMEEVWRRELAWQSTGVYEVNEGAEEDEEDEGAEEP